MHSWLILNGNYALHCYVRAMDDIGRHTFRASSIHYIKGGVNDHNDATPVNFERKLHLWTSSCSCVRAMDDTGRHAFRTSCIHHITGGVIDFYDTVLVDIEQNTTP